MCQPRQANIFFEVVAEKLIIYLFFIWEEFFKSVNYVRQEGPAILISRFFFFFFLISRLLLRMLRACVASFVWTSTKNEWNSWKAICDHARSDLGTCNFITRVLIIYHVKVTQSTAFEQKRFDLRSFSPILRNLWLLLV